MSPAVLQTSQPQIDGDRTGVSATQSFGNVDGTFFFFFFLIRRKQHLNLSVHRLKDLLPEAAGALDQTIIKSCLPAVGQLHKRTPTLQELETIPKKRRTTLSLTAVRSHAPRGRVASCFLSSRFKSRLLDVHMNSPECCTTLMKHRYSVVHC